MQRLIAASLTTLLVCGLTATAVYAGPITGISVTTNGSLRLTGIGADGTGRGTGFYTLGNCSNDSVKTTCLFSGTYSELSGSNPGDIGQFTLTTVYAGTSIDSPIVARSSVADPNSVGFVSPTLNGALMTLALMPGYGGVFTATLPPFPPTGLGFAGTSAGIVCSGAPLTNQLASQPGCNIGNVLLNAGAIGIGPLQPNGFNFTIPVNTPNTAPVPEPGTVALLGTGLALVVARMRRHRA